MANPNPVKARQAKKQQAARRKAMRTKGSLDDAVRAQWQAIATAQEVLLAAEDGALALRAVHALTQATQAYARLLEAGEVEARLAALEQALTRQRARAGARTAVA